MIYKKVEKAFGMDEDQNYQHSALTILGELISQEGTSQEVIYGKDENGKDQAERIINEI